MDKDLLSRLRAKPPTYEDATEAADEIERLREVLKQIRDFGPMTVDDQRWRIANNALQQKDSE